DGDKAENFMIPVPKCPRIIWGAPEAATRLGQVKRGGLPLARTGEDARCLVVIVADLPIAHHALRFAAGNRRAGLGIAVVVVIGSTREGADGEAIQVTVFRTLVNFPVGIAVLPRSWKLAI